MKETTAVLLGFGAVALTMVSLTGAALYVFSPMASPYPTNVGGDISKAFLATPVGGAPGQTAPVKEMASLIPAGTAAAAALGRLSANGFDCTRAVDRASCRRHIEKGMSDEDWTVALTFDMNETVSESLGLVRENAAFP